MADFDLDKAYQIDGPQTARTQYGEWAEVYDDAFVSEYGYIAPREIAAIFLEDFALDGPVLDIGAGTGVLAEHLPGVVLDGFDISAEMLAKAGAKGLYRNRVVGDLTQPLSDLADGSYSGVVSSGTFTHGHVGPECLPELLRITRPGARFVCGAKAEALDSLGFGSALAVMVAHAQITPVQFRDIPIYEGADHPHAGDRGLVMVFRKL